MACRLRRHLRLSSQPSHAQTRGVKRRHVHLGSCSFTALPPATQALCLVLALMCLCGLGLAARMPLSVGPQDRQQHALKPRLLTVPVSGLGSSMHVLFKACDGCEHL